MNGVFFQGILASFQNASAAGHLWVYALVIVMVMLEGPLSILIASTAATSGYLEPILVFAAASVGNLFGDILWYLLGRSGNIEWVLKLRFLKLDLERINFLRQSIARNAVKILLIAKLTNGMIVPTLIATGLARVPFRRWFPFIFVANIFTTGAFVGLGYYTALNLSRVDHWMRYVAIAFSIVFFLFVAFWIQRSFARRFSVEQLLTEEQEASR